MFNDSLAAIIVAGFISIFFSGYLHGKYTFRVASRNAFISYFLMQLTMLAVAASSAFALRAYLNRFVLVFIFTDSIWRILSILLTYKSYGVRLADSSRFGSR